VLDDVEGKDAAGLSAATVKGSWWRTAGTLFVLGVIGAAPGPVIGIILMVTVDAGVEFVNALSSFIYAAALPFSILGMAVLYRRHERTVTPAPASPAGSGEQGEGPGGLAGRLKPGTT
jgi:hypothetical protein